MPTLAGPVELDRPLGAHQRRFPCRAATFGRPSGLFKSFLEKSAALVFTGFVAQPVTDVMLLRSVVYGTLLLGALAASGGANPAQAQEPNCRFFKVEANSVNVAKEPRGDSVFIDVIDKNEIVCVTRDQQVGDRSWGFIAHKLVKPNHQVPVEGWVNMRSLQPASPTEIATVRGAPEPAAPPPAVAAAPADETVRFSEPITFGPYPVNGRSLEELINGIPMFPPIEGLDDRIWKKTCNNCHKWDRQTLCEQGAVYAKNPKAALRLSHPYGGADKIAMMKWAKGGCQ